MNPDSYIILRIQAVSI